MSLDVRRDETYGYVIRLPPVMKYADYNWPDQIPSCFSHHLTSPHCQTARARHHTSRPSDGDVIAKHETTRAKVAWAIRPRRESPTPLANTGPGI